MLLPRPTCYLRHYRRMSCFVKYEQFLRTRRDEARKSMLVQISRPELVDELSSYLTSSFGPLNALHHYSLPASSARVTTANPVKSENHWALAEFQDKSGLEKAVDACYRDNEELPKQFPVCLFRYGFSEKDNKENSKGKSDSAIPEEIVKEAIQSESFSGQMVALQEQMQITEVGLRTRFFVAHLLEITLRSLIPYGCVLPFGSSVCGLGKNSGDLDLVVLSNKVEVFPEDVPCRKESLLWNHSSDTVSGSRAQLRRVLETVADVLSLFLPGCKNVIRILQARVPILRFSLNYTGTLCDLSMTNSTGVHMTELIYMMVSLDQRFQPLVYTIRSWAAAQRITNSAPGKYITNFSLALMVIYFLQKKGIFPPWEILINNAGSEDVRKSMEGIDCTFMRDANRLGNYFTPLNKELTTADLLKEFFEYYADFDYGTHGMCLFTQKPWRKPDVGALYIQNPLERHMNVARNVTREEVSRFKSECARAVWNFETSANKDEALNLLELIQHSQKRVRHTFSSRIELKELLKES